MLGDFIHSLYTVKHICEKEGAKANIFLSDNIGKYGYDVWKIGAERAKHDLYDLVMAQPFVNSFGVTNDMDDDYINLNNWRYTAHNSGYSICWSELLQSSYNFPVPNEYKWLTTGTIEHAKDCVMIHRSSHRHNPNFDWESLINEIPNDILFLTSNKQEWEDFHFCKEQINLQLVSTISEMAMYINSCKMFIGNQSAPFALASALDVNRLVELDIAPAPFYIGESKYSNNISWFLNENSNLISDKSIIKNLKINL